MIESLGSRASLVLCMEPALPDGALKTARKGVANFHMVTSGKSAHSGADHQEGVNAIEEMAHFLFELGVDGLFTNNPDLFPRTPPEEGS